MRRRSNPKIITFGFAFGALLLTPCLQGCGSSREVQAPVASSASPGSFTHDPNDLRPPQTFAPGGQSVYRSLPAAPGATQSDAANAPAPRVAENLQEDKVDITNASAPATGSLALAAGLYVEAQELERTRAFPQAVAAYDRLLEVDGDYADAKSRRETLLELVSLADEFYVLAMDADSKQERLFYLRQVGQFWPGYRDVEQQLDGFKREAAQAAEQLKQAKKARAAKAKKAAKDK